MISLRIAATAAALLTLAAGVTGAAYDPVTALRSVFYTKVSKCAPAEVSNWTCPSCANFTAGTISDVTVVYSDPDEIQMFIAYNSEFNEIAVSFRGSTTLDNWIEDAEAWFSDYPQCKGCQVHTGFYNTYLQVAPNITAAVAGIVAKRPNATIFVSGHSMGAAQARLCALDLHRRFGRTNLVRTYTIGTPRFANRDLVAYAEAQLPSGEHFYITHDADPVPHLPPTSWGYLHFPQEVWYKKGITPAGYKVCNGTTVAEDPTCADSLPLPININDHLVYLGVSTGCSYAPDTSAVASLQKMIAKHRHMLELVNRAAEGKARRL